MALDDGPVVFVALETDPTIDLMLPNKHSKPSESNQLSQV